MKLNMDCVRAVMLCAEEYTDYNHYCYFISYQKNNVNDFLLDDPETPPAYQLELEKTYDNDDLFYAVEYCVKSGFVETLFSKDTYRIPISRITPDGHRFLENIRSDTNWEKVKSVAKKAGSFSADVIIEIAKNVAVEAAKHFLTNTDEPSYLCIFQFGLDCRFVVPDLLFFDSSFHDFFCDGSNGIFSRAYHAAVNLNFDLHFVLLRVNPVQLPAFQIGSPAAALLNPRISVLL